MQRRCPLLFDALGWHAILRGQLKRRDRSEFQEASSFDQRSLKGRSSWLPVAVIQAIWFLLLLMRMAIVPPSLARTCYAEHSCAELIGISLWSLRSANLRRGLWRLRNPSWAGGELGRWLLQIIPKT